MRRSAPLALALVALLLGLTVALAGPAEAHGIIIVDGDVIIVTPRPPTPPRPIPPRPMPPRRMENPVTLKGHRVEGTIDGRVATVTVEQVFHNHSGRQLEGTYLFPLPEGASVGEFAMTMGGKMVSGEVMEAKQAKQIYEDIVRRRRDPGLLEYVGRGLFKARVFPIEPHADLTIRLSFQQILPEDTGTMEFRYPLATDRLHGEPVDSVVVSLNVKSDVDLKTIYCPSHDVAIVRKGNREANVSYERTGKKQDRDFLLYVGRSPEDVGFSLLSHKAAGEDGTFLAVFAPSSDVPDDQLVPKDVVYVLDTSGSMAQDDKIGAARKALEYGVRVLNDKDRFNIIAFSGATRPFRDGLMPANGELKDAASKWISGLKAQGGTNIEEALQEALELRQDGRLFMVVFITDGRPTIGLRDPEALVKLVKEKNTSKTRIFTFGVGFDLDVRLLDSIAEATHASRDYVMPREDLEVVTSRFFRKVNQPVMSDVTVEFGSGVHDVYPRTFSDLFAGGQVVVMGRYDGAGDRVIRLKGKLGDKEVVHEYEATFKAGEGAEYLARLWAHRKVAYLLDAIRLNGEDSELVTSVVRLATRYGIVTPYTAGLVVEEGELATRGLRADAGERRARLGAQVEGLKRRLALPGRAEAMPMTPAPVASGDRGGGGASRPGAGAPMPAPTSPATPPPAERELRDSRELAKSKAADGFWEDDKEEADDDAYGLDAVREKVKAVADKTFLVGSDGRWVDTAWDKKAPLARVEAYSDAWYALLAKGKHVARYLALGEKVIVVVAGKAYEIVPPTVAPEK